MKKEDLFRAVGEIDDALIEDFENAAPRRRHWGRVGALAACVCVLAAGALVWLSGGSAPLPAQGTPTQPTATTALASAGETQPGLTPLSALPQLSYAEGGGELAADIALPDGYFFRDLTDGALASIWGMETLSWEGCDAAALGLDGRLIYDGTGRVWRAVLSGELGGSSFTVTLSPERVPATCIVHEGGATCEIYGTDVTALRSGDYIEITFLRGEGASAVGVRIEAYHATAETEELLTRIVSQSLREDGVLQLDQLKTDDVPAWRSEVLTEPQARAEEGFGEYLPDTLPAGYGFESAHRELGEDRNWLSATWCRDYASVSVTVDKCADLRGLVHADEVEKYDRDYYGADKPDVPDEYYDSWSSPVFYAQELTKEVVARRVSESDMGNVYTHFGVLYPDGTVVCVSVSAPETELWQLLAFLLP